MEGGGGNAGYGKGLGFPWNYWEATGSKTADWNGLLNPNHVTRGSESAHLTCLNLGKRHYLEQGGESLGGKKGRGVGPSSSCSSSSSSSSLLPPVPRCQVEGCQVPLTHAKDYHRRHKVCELHSKAPKVVVLGLEQRFCQQCSRFHVVSEFDDSKRSCRRRLAGHNERRRKSAHDFTNPRNHSQDNHVMDGTFPCISSMTGRALSLLSSKTSWVSSADVSSRSSAALRELIAENRAAVLARQLFSDRGLHSGPESAGAQEYLTHMPHQHQMSREVGHLVPEWSHLDGPMAHVTLDLMQPPDSSEFMSGRSRVKADEECCEIWKSLEGTHVL